MTLDFSGQRLRGKSFQGQDLSGADFSRADLRGADFSRSTLRRANFTAARMGLLPLHRSLLVGLLTLLALLSGGLAYLLGGMWLMMATAESSGAIAVAIPLISQPLNIPVPPIPAVMLPLFTGLLSFVMLVGMRSGVERAQKLLLTILVIIVVLVSMILGSYGDWGHALAQLGLGLAIALGLAQLIGTLVVGAELLAGPVAGCGIAALALGAAWVAAQGVVAQGVVAQGVVAPVGLAWASVALGVLWAWRSERYRDIRQGAVAVLARCGTRFYGADLSEADLSGALLAQCDLREAVLTRTRFWGSDRLDEAWVKGSILEQPGVLQVLMTGKGRGQVWREMNLQGANLRDADLREADFCDADLRQATLENANLERANLTRVNALGTSFRAAQLTGACVADWNVDASTRLDAVDCRYLYGKTVGQGAIVGRAGDRLPPQGDWPVGEFTRRFAVTGQDQASIFELESLRLQANTDPDQKQDPDLDQTADEGLINPQEVLASLMVLVRLAIADGQLEGTERELLAEALGALDLPAEITVERVLDDRTPLDALLDKVNSPIIREKVYQSAYLMARIDGELEQAEEQLLRRIQTRLGIAAGKVEKLQQMVEEAKELSIAEQVEAMTDPEQREAAVNTNIRLMALMHAFSGAMPIPGFAIVTHLMIYKDQVELVQKIARLWGYPADYKSTALDQAIFGTMGATAARVALSNVALLIPVWGSVIGASTAFSMTWAIGELTQRFFASGGMVEDEMSLAEQFANAKQVGLQQFRDYQALIATKQQAVLEALRDLQARLQKGELTQQNYGVAMREMLRERLDEER